jgi:hypothetical protein
LFIETFLRAPRALNDLKFPRRDRGRRSNAKPFGLCCRLTIAGNADPGKSLN